jgi:subtilisin
MFRQTQVICLSALALLVIALLAGCSGGPATSPADTQVAAAATTESAAADGPSRVLIGFKQKPGAAEQNLVRGVGGRVKYTYTLVPAIAASVPAQAIDGLRRNPNVTVVEPDAIATAIADTLPWGVNRIDAEVVHAGGNTGAGVKVAIIDTGIDYTHPDLDGNYKGGYDYVNGDADPMDDHGHGTHVSGTVAAEQNGLGVIGVAPTASLYGLKVLSATGSGYYSDIIAAIQWSAANGMQVASMSLGGSSGSSTLEAACNNAVAAGVLLVAAAGNSGNSKGNRDNVGYPARYASVIAVAATGQTDTRASWSSTGPAVELAAPGVGIYSTLRGGGYGNMSGTSMACPHVSGVAALVIASGLTGSQAVRDRLAQTADDLGTAGRDPWYGFGLVDADEAAGSVTPPPPPPPGAAMHVAGLTMSVLTSGRQKSARATVTIVDAGGQPVEGAAVSGRWSGLTTDSDTGTTATNGQVALQSNKTKLASGTFTFTVTGVSKSGWTYDSAANVETSDSISIP